MLSHPRRGDQQSVEEQSSLVPVREPETRSVPAGLPDCRLSDGEPRGCGVPDDDPEDDPERAAPDGRLQQQPRQFQSTSVIKRLERSSSLRCFIGSHKKTFLLSSHFHRNYFSLIVF